MTPIDITCPKCGANAGDACTSVPELGQRYVKVLSHFHAERERRANKLRADYSRIGQNPPEQQARLKRVLAFEVFEPMCTCRMRPWPHYHSDAERAAIQRAWQRDLSSPGIKIDSPEQSGDRVIGSSGEVTADSQPLIANRLSLGSS